MTTTPITAEIATQLARPPANTAKEIWLYELGRFLIQKTNSIIVALFADDPPCSAQTCPEMRASEWQYLCAVHDPPKSCSAIDYCCHTLDWAATTLTSSKMFPSRLGLGSGNAGAGSDKFLQQQMKEITNIFRRVYRIYAHAWFQHREMFWRVESKTGLYVFFKTVCDEYGMIQPENYTIPPEAEGLEPEESGRETQQEQSFPGVSLLKRDSVERSSSEEPISLPEATGNAVIGPGDTSKRHRHTMSGSISTVIQEEAEDEEGSPEQSPVITLPERPALEKQQTVLRDPVEQKLPTAEKDVEDEEKVKEEPAGEEDDEPIMGISRSDTAKPPKDESTSETKAEEDEEDEDDDPNVTVLVAEVDDEDEPAPAPPSKDEAPEINIEDPVETSEPTSGDAKEAGQSAAE